MEPAACTVRAGQLTPRDPWPEPAARTMHTGGSDCGGGGRLQNEMAAPKSTAIHANDRASGSNAETWERGDGKAVHTARAGQPTPGSRGCTKQNPLRTICTHTAPGVLRQAAHMLYARIYGHAHGQPSLAPPHGKKNGRKRQRRPHARCTLEIPCQAPRNLLSGTGHAQDACWPAPSPELSEPDPTARCMLASPDTGWLADSRMYASVFAWPEPTARKMHAGRSGCYVQAQAIRTFQAAHAQSPMHAADAK